MTVAGTAIPTIGFTGHVNDADTGLTYMQQRYYDPVAGRFLSEDTVLTDANTGKSFNRYVYASNNPYKYIDPDGRQDRNAYEPYQKPFVAVENAFKSMFGSVDRASAIAAGAVSKTTISVSYVEVQRTTSSSGSSTYAGLRSSPAFAIQSTLEGQTKVGDASGVTVKSSTSVGFGSVGGTASASLTVGNGISAQASAGGIGFANDKGAFSQGGVIAGFRPPAAGIGITITDKDAKKVVDFVKQNLESK